MTSMLLTGDQYLSMPKRVQSIFQRNQLYYNTFNWDIVVEDTQLKDKNTRSHTKVTYTSFKNSLEFLWEVNGVITEVAFNILLYSQFSRITFIHIPTQRVEGESI